MVIYISEKEKVCVNCEHFMPCMVRAESRTMIGYIGVCAVNKMSRNSTAAKCKFWEAKGE